MTTSTCWVPPVAALARIGFGSGWLILAPTFLNFGLPAVLVDYRLIQDADLQLEPFASHDPLAPWWEANARLRYSDGKLGLWRLGPERLIAAELQVGGAAGIAELSSHNRMVLLIGDTYDVQLSWSALWGCRIGACNMERRD